jgi:cytochrome b6-f complex iron-sulfur subunit
MTDMDRREFVASCAMLSAAFLAGCASMVTHPVPVVAGRIQLSLGQYPELARPDGAVKLQPAGQEDPIYVLARGGEFVAVSPICTHRGCTVDVQGERLVCPCHGSTYDREGKVLKGPAQRALTRFRVSRAADTLTIEL